MLRSSFNLTVIENEYQINLIKNIMFLSSFFLFLIIAICSTFNYAVANPILFSPDQQAMPDDFKDYFYHSEIPVQVYLNDKILFDADMTLTEAGTITLVRLASKNESVYDSADMHDAQ
ncbi:hypothetical protein [Candidatus Regiella insecticola]|uniref:hypothetical protein n=1 Tax=Candidatus Regiella insecticola TaxID=138073 RepID=UPI001596B4F1|nr:hypothetical protein [Candidatus Regiella insecticola]